MSAAHYITAVIRGKLHWLNNCDGFSEQKSAARCFTARSDGERAIHTLKADPRWAQAHPIRLMRRNDV